MRKEPFGITFSLSEITIDEAGRVIVNNSKLAKILKESISSLNSSRNAREADDQNYATQCGCHNHVRLCGCRPPE